MRTFPESLPQTIFFFFCYLLLLFFSGFCQFWEQCADENLPCILSPYYLMFFWLFFALFSGFCQFWEQSANEHLPYILSPYYLYFFWLFIVFFLGFLPVLRTICRWKPSLHPFLILFDLFVIILWALILFSLFFAFWVCFFVDYLFWIRSLFFGVCGVCGFATLVYLIPRSESDTASVWEQLRKILAALWSEECLCWFMG